jgi:hypothetical protein
MTRLPKPGGDDSKWADLLNEFLLVAHNPDGTPRKDGPGALAGTVGLADLRTSNLPTEAPIRTPILSYSDGELVWKNTIEINVLDYGAKGDGVTDDTEAIQDAVNAAGSGLVVLPNGIFMVRTIKIRNKGMALRGDGRYGTRIRRYSGTEPLLDISGSGTGIGHQRYDTISNLQVDGNNMPGTLLRSYYSDSCVYREVAFTNCPGVATDLVEVWDTRFENCIWEHCGSSTEPATLLRNSTPPGTFGFSEDNTNQIYFISCRWEGFRNGALRLDGTANGSTERLNGVFIVACKMETSLAAGPILQIMPSTTIVFINQLYLALLKTIPDFATPLDAIVDHGTQIFITSLYIQWGPAPGLANSAIHTIRSGPHMYKEISAYYPAEPPAMATILADADTNVIVAVLSANRGQTIQGDVSLMMQSDPEFGLALSLKNSGAFRIVSEVTGKDLLKADNSSTRPTLHTVNGTDLAGFSGDFVGEKWRFYGDTGFVRLASGKFQIEGTKGYVGINNAPYAGIAMLIRPVADGDRGLTIVRPSSTATNRLLEFQDENHNVQGQAFDSHGRPIAVGSPPNVAKGDQVSYANPRVRVQDIAGNISAAVRPAPTAPGTIAIVTFSRPFAAVPLAITINDHSVINADLYVSARSTTSFTVSTRRALNGGAILNFDYIVAA